MGVGAAFKASTPSPVIEFHPSGPAHLLLARF